MGSVVTKAAGSVGTLIGDAFLAPFKTILGTSCEGICSGTWDLTCFVEHLCISSLVRLFMVIVLTYIILLFIYLVFKVGIIQCIGKSLCKMTWVACETYWTALGEISCFCWHKIRNTKRVNRRRQIEDIEEGYFSSDYDSSSEKDSLDASVIRRRRLGVDRRKERMRKSLYPIRRDSKRRRRSSRRRHGSHHNHVRLNTGELPVHLKGQGSSSSRILQLRSTGHGSRK